MSETQRDVLGFVKERCPHCNARLFVSDEGATKGPFRPICLNGCSLTVWQSLEMQRGLEEAARRTGLPVREEGGHE